MGTILYSLVALGLVGACDRDTGEKRVVEVRKTVDHDDGTRTVETRRFDLEAERTNLSRAIEERTARLDAKIDELERRGDEKSKDAAATLRAKRDQARAKLAELGNRTQDNWETFKRDVSDTWDGLERDVTEATR